MPGTDSKRARATPMTRRYVAARMHDVLSISPEDAVRLPVDWLWTRPRVCLGYLDARELGIYMPLIGRQVTQASISIVHSWPVGYGPHSKWAIIIRDILSCDEMVYYSGRKGGLAQVWTERAWPEPSTSRTDGGG